MLCRVASVLLNYKITRLSNYEAVAKSNITVLLNYKITRLSNLKLRRESAY